MQFQSAATAMQTISDTVTFPKGSGYVDSRQYENGTVRLRFRLTPARSQIVDAALAKCYLLAPTLAEHAALSNICLDYLSSESGLPLDDSQPGGKTERRLFKVYPDEYEVIRFAFDKARQQIAEPDDIRALVLVCQAFNAAHGATECKTDSL